MREIRFAADKLFKEEDNSEIIMIIWSVTYDKNNRVKYFQ